MPSQSQALETFEQTIRHQSPNGSELFRHWYYENNSKYCSIFQLDCAQLANNEWDKPFIETIPSLPHRIPIRCSTQNKLSSSIDMYLSQPITTK